MFKLLNVLKNRLDYNPETGLFRYRHDLNIMKKGDVAGTANTNGHIQISINNKLYLAHNLAWFYMTEVYPFDFIVDHIDRVYDNNKWNNLRKANVSQNQGNSSIRIDNKSGAKGVYWNEKKKRWIAQITINNKRTHLGTFVSKESAKQAYKEAANLHFGKFANV